jgi:hypothetical protein
LAFSSSSAALMCQIYLDLRPNQGVSGDL